MEKSGLKKETETPERLVRRLAFRLQRHKLWDFFLVLFPPLLASVYLILFLSFRRFLSWEGLLVAGAAILATALAVWLVARRRWNDFSPPFAARLVDRRVAGQDRFITLATLPPSPGTPPLLARVRREAAGLLNLLNLTKDFPYRIKPAFFFSLVGSLATALLVHLLLQVAFISQPEAAAVRELELLAKRLSEVPGLTELARNLEAAARRLDEPGLSDKEKLVVVLELRKKIEETAGTQRQQGEGRDERNQVADALKRLEKGLEGSRDQGEGAGLKSNLPEEKGKEKESGQGGGGEGKSESADLGSKDLKGGKAAQRDPNKDDLSEGLSEKDRGQGNKIEREKETGRETERMAKEGQEGRGGRNKGEEIPPKGPIPERFTKPGEQGEGGIKGARFVIVELPEILESSAAKDSAGLEEARKKVTPKTPISNTPLPRPAGPQASLEKQPVPLEYRELIR